MTVYEAMNQRRSHRPVQLYHLTLKGGQCETIEPHHDLASHIHFYWSMNIDCGEVELVIIPDAAIDLVVSPDLPRFAALFLPQATPFTLKLRGPIRYFGVSFQTAGATPLLHTDLVGMRALSVGDETVQRLGLEVLTPDLQSCLSIETIKASFDSHFLAQRDASIIPRSEPALEPRSLFALIENTVGQAGIDSVCRTLQISDRQCRRLSSDLLGLSPKKLQRVLRLQAAVRELIGTTPGMRQDLYYDDSHRIHELKGLTGLTPNQIRCLAETYNP